MPIRVEIYQNSQKSVWDNFVKASKNGTFLFLRDYMDYHSDRFQDHSLLIWDDELIAILPANRRHNQLVSHGGLTYGGFITCPSIKTPKILEVFEKTLLFLKQNSFNKITYKDIPYIYHKVPSEENKYCLFLCNASLVGRQIYTVVDTSNRLPFQDRRNRGIKKAIKQGLTVDESADFAAYWKVLESVLWETYQAKPVHTLEEIILLKSRFPENIKLFTCSKDDIILAGVVIYESDKVARAQYIAATAQGKSLGALDLLFHFLLNNIYSKKPFFDFGSSDKELGQYLNKGLIEQKEGFGGRTVVQDHYEIDLLDWKPDQLIRAMT